MDQTKIGEFITQLRKQQGLTQKQLAEKLHVSVTAVCKWEKGVNAPDISNLEALSDFFQISVSELLCGEKQLTQIIDGNTTQDITGENVNKLSRRNIYKYLFSSTLMLFGLIVVVYISIFYYNNRPLKYKIIDSYYAEAKVEHQEAYGVDTAFWVIIEYNGNFNERHSYELDEEIAYDFMLNQNIDADIMYIEYYDNYKKNITYDAISFLFLPLPDINNDSY